MLHKCNISKVWKARLLIYNTPLDAPGAYFAPQLVTPGGFGQLGLGYICCLLHCTLNCSYCADHRCQVDSQIHKVLTHCLFFFKRYPTLAVSAYG